MQIPREGEGSTLNIDDILLKYDPHERFIVVTLPSIFTLVYGDISASKTSFSGAP